MKTKEKIHAGVNKGIYIPDFLFLFLNLLEANHSKLLVQNLHGFSEE
jgi:hypothetical protein